MIDESTDVSVIGHIVVFATFIEEGISTTAFSGLLEFLRGKKKHI